jgi:CheY-like chemotaxis protein
MSHELRTPLNAIIGYSEILQEDAENLGQKECISDLQKVHAAGEHLLGLINDVLELSKIEAGQMDLLIEEVDINTLIDEVIGTIKLQVEKNANILTIECSDVLGKMQVDRIKLRKMLLNLLGNAAKFTKEGTICFKIERKTRFDAEWMVFSVADDGIGITEEQQAKLFQPFTQADSSSTRRYGGTGLGLSITKQFSEMMGGTIQLESQSKKGSTFTLYLPVPAQPVSSKKISRAITPYNSVKYDEIVVTDDDSTIRKSSKEDLRSTNSKAHILIIDDAPREFQFLIDLLTDAGFKICIAEEDEEGIQQARDMRPDLILLDVVMPGIGGFEVCRRLKSQEETRNIPIIFMTALDDTANIVAGFELGAVDYITKPFQYKEVLARINTQITINEQKQQLIKQNQQLQQEIGVRSRKSGSGE